MYLENYWGYGDNQQRNRREILSIIRKKICHGSEITFWSRTNGSKLPSMSEMIWNFESMFLLNYFTDCDRLWLIGKGIWCVLRKNNPVKKTSIQMYFGHVSRGKMYSHNIYHQTLIMATRTTPLKWGARPRRGQKIVRGRKSGGHKVQTPPKAAEKKSNTLSQQSCLRWKSRLH